MSVAFRDDSENPTVNKEHVFEALREHADSTESLFSNLEKDFLETLVNICKARRAYKFTFPSMSPMLYRYTNKSKEYNILNVEELGAGRRGTIYSFDYAYSVLKDHAYPLRLRYGKINKDRTLNDGQWIARVAQISSDLIEQASFPGKIEGVITYITDNRDAGFIVCDKDTKHFFLSKIL